MPNITAPFRKRRVTGLIPEPWAGSPRSVEQAVGAAAESQPMPTEAKIWPMGPVLDQGSEGACAGFATTADLIAEPMSQRSIAASLGNAFGFLIYRRARVYGGEPVEPPKGDDGGSYVADNMLAAIEYGLVDGYRRIASVEDLANEIVTTGPVILSAKWWRSFDQTADSGLMTYKTDDDTQTWHAVCIVGYHPSLALEAKQTVPLWRKFWRVDKKTGKRERVWQKRKNLPAPPLLPPEPMFAIRNSWGTGWGAKAGKTRNGTGWMRVRDLRHMWDSGTAYAHAATGRRSVDLAAVLAAHPDPTQPPNPPRNWI